MARSLALLALSSAVMAAQSTTVDLLLPFADIQSLVGSVIAADSTATTYAYGCPSGTPSDDCGFDGIQTITQGPSTWVYSTTYTPDMGGTYIQGGHCKLNTAADAASCTVYATQTDETGSVLATSSAGVSTFLNLQIPVTVTAGLDKLNATPGASPTDGSTSAPTNTGASETGQTTASAPTTLAKQTTGTNTASSTAGPTSTNAAGVVNAQNGLLAGVAAIVGGAMML
ncbi:hypothetical protein TARUN_7015 [Trichoderma arundinaceum]|uniref:Uncharacterized protein n=1 Tax=Trichoderma arundinaceum TaxID=490622 RepID=A0A395NH12_TRIAR|nr:hypothetical protein TARUN_7015 [Trichoderma arundinaceum]